MRKWVMAPRDEESPMSGEWPELSVRVRRLLAARGISSREEAERFLAPDYERDTHDPYLMHDMERAVRRITEAVGRNEKTVIFADYDADGIPGSVILHDFFKKIGFENFEVYIPHRNREGFGLNLEAIKQFKEKGARLLITIDCGMTNVREVEAAHAGGIDVIITDHHVPPEKPPRAHAIVNPNQSWCRYPWNGLSGGALAYKLVQGLMKSGRFAVEPEGWEKWLLDCAAIATLSDMVPLRDENRALAHYGLSVLRRARRPGIRALLRRRGMRPEFLTEEDVSFIITPHINAASRMASPEVAFELLAASAPSDAASVAAELSSLNDKRKRVVEAMVEEAEALISGNPQKIISLGAREWMPSLLGLAASRISEKYNRTVCLWGKEGGDMIRGSCRSNGDINIVSLMGGVEGGFFSDFGGHAASGGFVLEEEERSGELERRLLRAYEACVREEVANELVIDDELSLGEAGEALFEEQNACAPFGVGNPKPLWLFRGVAVREARFTGKEKQHVNLLLEDARGARASAIGFFAVGRIGRAEDFARGRVLDVVAHLEREAFRGRRSLRLRLVDVKDASRGA